MTSVLVVNAGSSSLKLRQLDDDVLARHADLAPDGDLDALLRDWTLSGTASCTAAPASPGPS